jgi:FkbM family methyltransferase
MQRYGTVYGGWNLPTDIQLGANSIIYSAGVGEDISFDILIQEKFKLTIVLIDPTYRALKHYEEIQEFFKNNIPIFTGDIQKDYLTNITKSKPDFSRFIYINKGLWSHRDFLKFYKPENEKYVSHTLIKDMYSKNYEQVEVDSIKNIMTSLNHTHIDILKLDIEGSEIVVLEQMLKDKIFPRYICVEFDLRIKRVDYQDKTTEIIKALEDSNYNMIDNNQWNCLFILRS